MSNLLDKFGRQCTSNSLDLKDIQLDWCSSHLKGHNPLCIGYKKSHSCIPHSQFDSLTNDYSTKIKLKLSQVLEAE